MKSPAATTTVVLAFLALCGAALYFTMGRGPDRGGTPEATTAKPLAKATPEGSAEPVAPPREAIVIEYHSSDGKKDWVEEVTKAFNKQSVLIEGRPVVVKLKHIRSGESMRDISDGKAKPTLWSPVSASWIELVNQRWQVRHQKNFMTKFQPTVEVAMIIGIWEPMARALGWPDKPVGWEELVKVALDPNGWASYGHPEWSQFRFGHAHPDYSTSAMLSVLSLIYASAHKTANLTAEDLKSPEVVQGVEAIEKAIVHYGKSSGWLTAKMCQRGPSYLNAVTLYESNVVSFNDTCKDKPYRMVAIYPKEGTFWEDHPTGVVEADWVGPLERSAAEAYLSYLVSDAAQALLPKYGYRPASPAVPLRPPFDLEHGVDPAQKPLITLAKVSDDVFQRANVLWHQVKPKATVYVLLDVSGSMQGAKINAAKKSTVAFIKRMEKDDEIQVLAFSSSLHPLAELKPVREVGETLVEKVEGLYGGSGTALYDSIAFGLKEIQEAKKKRQEKRTYGLVVLTDGADTASKMSLPDLRALLPRGEDVEAIRIYTIAFGEEANEDLLREISDRSNGLMQKGSLENIDAVYEAISAYF